MQKTIRILAIIAAILVALSFLLLLISIPFQRLIADKGFGYSQDIIGLLPVVPWAVIAECFVLLGCAILLIVCANSKKSGIWLEILLLAAVVAVLPVLNTVLSNVQNVLFVNVRGSTYVAANSVANLISSYCMWPGNLGHSVLLVVAGMSMVHKHMSKKLAKVTE